MREAQLHPETTAVGHGGSVPAGSPTDALAIGVKDAFPAAVTAVVRHVTTHLVPRLAPTAVIRLTPHAAGRPGAAPRVFTIRDGGAASPRRLEALPEPDRADPADDVPGDEARLWIEERGIPGVIAAGTPAMGIGLSREGVALAAVALYRDPGAAAFTLDDLVDLEALARLDPAASPIAEARPDHDPLIDDAPTALPGWRDAGAGLFQNLLNHGNLPDLCRELASVSLTAFAACGAVVYLVPPDDLAPRDPAAEPGVRLRLAASAGTTTLLVPPWLPRTDTARPTDLFRIDRHGVVLAPEAAADQTLLDRQQPDGTLHRALLLRDGRRIVGVVGLRQPHRRGALPLDVAEFASMLATALTFAGRIEADRLAALAARADQARASLAAAATSALIGPADASGLLEAHADRVVPQLADGYVVYLFDREPAAGSAATAAQRPVRAFSRWQTQHDTVRVDEFERWIDRRVLPALRQSGPRDASASSSGAGDDAQGSPEGSSGPMSLPFRVPDVSPTPETDRAEQWDRTLRTVVAVPLIAAGETLGALVLAQSGAGRRSATLETRFVEALSGPLATALAARLPPDGHGVPTEGVSAELEAESGWMMAADLARKLVGVTETEAIAAETVDHLAETVADWAALEIHPGPGAPVMTFGAHANPDQLWPRHLWDRLAADRVTGHGPGRVLATGRPELSIQASWVPRGLVPAEGDVAAVEALIPTTSLSVAITLRDGIAGVLTAVRTRANEPFGLADLDYAEAVGAVASAALTTAITFSDAVEQNRLLETGTREITGFLDHVGDGLLIADAAGTIIFTSERVRAFVGEGCRIGLIADYLAATAPRGIDGQPMAADRLPLSETLRTGEPAVHSWFARSADGTRIFTMGASQPLRDPAGALAGAIMVLVDITGEIGIFQQRLREIELAGLALRIPMFSVKGWAQYLASDSRSAQDGPQRARAGEAIVSQIRSLQERIDQLVALTGRVLHDADDPVVVAEEAGYPSADVPDPER